jgi:hypothetical protein
MVIAGKKSAGYPYPKNQPSIMKKERQSPRKKQPLL